MWRFIPGSVRECLKGRYSKTVQPRVNLDNDARTHLRSQLCHYVKKFVPCTCNPTNGQFNYRRGTNANGHDKNNWETNYYHILQRNWIGALGWSGILIAGWYISHPSDLRTLIYNKGRRNDQTNEYVSPVGILARSVLAQPTNQIVSPSQSNLSEQSKETGSQFINDSLDKAAENFAKAHGSVENRLGVELARRQYYKDAVFLFNRAVDRGHAIAAFNLALCHELGLGTQQDFQKAAELYEIASSSGHATATYNLGVFYVHGWGGKKVDYQQAKKLFVSAANLGQVNAQRALGMVENEVKGKTEDKVLYNGDNSSISQLVKDTVYKYTSFFES